MHACRGSARTWVVAALAVAACVVVADFAVRSWLATRQDDVASQHAHEQAVAEQARPLEQAFAAANAVAQEPYDIEKTMRVVHELDSSVQHVSSIREYLDLVGRADYRHVAPRVLETRKQIVDVLLRYYAALEAKQDQDALWRYFRERVDRLIPSSFHVGLGGVDVKFEERTEQDKGRADALERDREAAVRQLGDRVREIEAELARAMADAEPVLRDVEDEWGQLCLQRDRAYLEAFDMRFDEARRSAEAALALAPSDVESQLLRALALVEGASAERENEPDALTLLDALLREHPDNAPALLLRGLWKVRHGRAEEGRVDMQLASTRYPEQAQALADDLDPYRMRTYLQRSQQGVHITGMYRSMMLGAAWFSPELQTARLDFESGAVEHAKQLVREHFARRRAQGQWELIRFDLRFCEDLLGEHYREIFPERSYLDLIVERNHFGRDYSVYVDNRSDVSRHNATLVLCVRFTDMQPEDYDAVVAGSTRPIVPAATRTQFDDVDLRHAWGATEKGPSDIVPPVRAILIADESVCWVDTIEFKDETTPRFADLRDASSPAAANVSLPARWRQALEALKAGPVRVERIKNLVTSDDLRIELPREVALLGPLFELDIGSKTFAEGKGGGVHNRIEDNVVRLVFDGAGKALDAAPAELRLRARSSLGNVTVAFARGADGSYSVAKVE
jgi:tetratricopeptide (TPR) repeat protein